MAYPPHECAGRGHELVDAGILGVCGVEVRAVAIQAPDKRELTVTAASAHIAVHAPMRSRVAHMQALAVAVRRQRVHRANPTLILTCGHEEALNGRAGGHVEIGSVAGQARAVDLHLWDAPHSGCWRVGLWRASHAPAGRVGLACETDTTACASRR